MLVHEVPPTFPLSPGKSHTKQEMDISSASSRLNFGLARRRAHVEVAYVGVRRALGKQHKKQRGHR